MLTNREILLPVAADAGQRTRLESSLDLRDWTGLATLLNTASSNSFTDSAAPFLARRFYRGVEAATNAISGDHLLTMQGEITFHPVDHASFVFTWQGRTVYCDPVGGATPYAALPRADLILVTHSHSDHFDTATLNGVKSSNTVIVVPAAVYQSLPASLKTNAIQLANGAITNLLEINVEAVPAYNLTSTYHPKGVGNGYVLTIGGKRIYVSGDTEDIPELRNLPDIDVAFVCMNLPFTMSVAKAADAVRQFRPKVVYLYHYRGYGNADVLRFKQLVGTDQGTEVRIRKWY